MEHAAQYCIILFHTIVEYFILCEGQFAVIFSDTVKQCFGFPVTSDQRSNNTTMNMALAHFPGGLVRGFGGNGGDRLCAREYAG